jgi:hypothetical protein
MRRWLVTLAAVAVVVALVTYTRSRPVDVHPEDVLRLEIGPYPEGPPGPTFTREPHREDPTSLTFDLGLVERWIPDPLPNTAWQGVNCTMGGTLSVTLLDGEETITYGPCRRPDSINELWAHMLDVSSDGECRPGCGPGGMMGPSGVG